MSKKSGNKENFAKIDKLRYNEYYDMQTEFDEIYKKSKNGETFNNLMDLILDERNILLAYRNIKRNSGSLTTGTDGLTIKDIENLSKEEYIEKVRYILNGSKHGYRPKPVRRKDIPKNDHSGKTRPLGIPCIWDRIIQQCIKQVMEPVCEAKFNDHSYGFRPIRSVENAIKDCYKNMQQTKLHYVVEFDIKGFFDNVNHSKLIRQIWALGIRDKKLIYILRQMLKAPIKHNNGVIEIPQKGTPQGGILSPLLANVVLNELDWWIDSQWRSHPVVIETADRVAPKVDSKGQVWPRYDIGYYHLRKKSKTKEMYIVRYADDFRIFCRSQNEAEKIKIAVTKWLQKRLKLEISEEKTKCINLRKKWSDFLGFKMKLYKKSGKWVVKSRMSDKALERTKNELISQINNIAKPRHDHKKGSFTRDVEINLYNSKVMGIQNYFKFATHITQDSRILNRCAMTKLANSLNNECCKMLVKEGRDLTPVEVKRYGNSKRMRYEKSTQKPIYPIGHVQHKNPMSKIRDLNVYTKQGREFIHKKLKISNIYLQVEMMKEIKGNRTTEFMDNRISLFSAQYGKCAITGKEFETISEIHCHHRKPKKIGGEDKYSNLVLVLEDVHRLIHATNSETIERYLKILNLNSAQMVKLNKLRKQAKLEVI